MTKLKKIFFCAIMVVCIICSMCPTFAFAADDDMTFTVDMSRPVADDNHGYLELLYKTPSGDYVARVLAFTYSWRYYTNEGVTVDNPNANVQITVTSAGVVKIVLNDSLDSSYGSFSTLSMWSDGLYGYKSVYWIDSHTYTDSYDGYTIVNARAYGGYSTFSSGFDQSFPPDFDIVYDDNAPIYNQLLDVVSLLTQLGEYDVTIIDELNRILSETTEIKGQMHGVLSLLNGILADLDLIVDYTDEIEYWLFECWNVLQEVRDYTWNVYLELHKANKKLDRIIELLNSSGESDLTSPDTSNLDNYYEMEQSLLDNSNVDVSSAVKVEIDQNALVVIWDMVQSCLDTHPQVFGLVITVLSLSIIALILGRGKS